MVRSWTSLITTDSGGLPGKQTGQLEVCFVVPRLLSRSHTMLTNPVAPSNHLRTIGSSEPDASPISESASEELGAEYMTIDPDEYKEWSRGRTAGLGASALGEETDVAGSERGSDSHVYKARALYPCESFVDHVFNPLTCFSIRYSLARRSE
jgi:hypothetical protein